MGLTWVAPGPGQWALDRSHTNRPAAPILQDIQATSMRRGLARVFKELGVPALGLDMCFVNGLVYTRLVPLIGGDKAPKKLPPNWVLKVAVRVHPEMRRRAKTAATSLEQRPWRKVVADWENGGRTAVENANLALQDVDLSALSDADLCAHVGRTLDHCRVHWEMHFYLHGFDLGPIGLLLYETKQWGLDADEVIPLLEGASPSTSQPVRVLEHIRALVEASGTVPNSLDELRALSPEIRDEVDRYLRFRGAVLFSRYDLDGLTLGEVPGVVLATILSASHHSRGSEIEALTTAVRSKVPAEHRARFDETLGEARAAMNLRDDNGPNTAEWPLGLVRLALLEVGQRMVRCGAAGQADHTLELRTDELEPALLSGGGPGAAALAGRAAVRRDAVVDDAPPTLGDPEPAPPLDVMPPSLARLVAMVQLVIAQTGMDGRREADGLQGNGVGTATYRGRACRAGSPEEAIDRLEPGDVLVVPCTTPAYNVVLSLAGAVVTAEGGPLSHAAVLARELGIPAVVGAWGALQQIPDGAIVDVDPVAGQVRIVAG